MMEKEINGQIRWVKLDVSGQEEVKLLTAVGCEGAVESRAMVIFLSTR